MFVDCSFSITLHYEKYNLEEVKDILRKRNGTSEEILAEDELIEMLSLSIIADIIAVSIALRGYHCTPDLSVKFDCGVTVIRGNRERNTENSHRKWEEYLNTDINYLTVEGDHFFLFKEGKNGLRNMLSHKFQT